MTDVEAWQAFTQFADRQVLLSSEVSALQQAVASSHAAIYTLCTAGLAELASNHVLNRAKEIMQCQHIPHFWSKLGAAPAGGPGLEPCLLDALQGLSSALQQHEQLLSLLRAELLGKGTGSAQTAGQAGQGLSSAVVGMCTRYQQAVLAMIQDSAPVSLTGLLEAYFTHKLVEFHDVVLGPGTEDMASEPAQDAMEAQYRAEEVMVPEWVHPVRGIASALATLGMQEECMSACGRAVCKHVHAYVHERPDYVRGLLQPALAFVGAVALPILALIVSDRDKALSSWAKRLQYYVYETVGSLRIGQFFNIVTDLPESQPALSDVRECLRHTHSHARFISRFTAAINQRLLQPGAATPDIISQYVGCIRALREVDPAGVLLNAVGGPIKAYLRSRRDTIRCILASLTDDADGDASEAPHGESLFEELEQPPEPEEDDMNTDTDNWEAFQAALKWEPDPVEVDLLHSHKKEKGTDIISMLVAIYGSKELFINEYRSMLAGKLLAKGDYNCDKEIRTLELLKIRFGDANLLNCEIMLKDMADSKRINQNIHHITTQSEPGRRLSAHKTARLEGFSATVVSSLFWPAQPDEDFTLPQRVQQQMTTYAARFHVVKTPRKLVWMKSLGSVDLSLTVGAQDFDFTVAPIHAAIILRFKERPAWHAAELAAAMGLTQEALRRRVLFWTGQGALQETATQGGTVYSRCETLERAAPGTSAAGDMAMEEDAGPSAAEAQEQQEMAVYEQYVMGMLTNFDSGLPLDRIHNMLKMFCSTPPYDRTADQLAAFLTSLVAADKVACEGGLYKKSKAAA